MRGGRNDSVLEKRAVQIARERQLALRPPLLTRMHAAIFIVVERSVYDSL